MRLESDSLGELPVPDEAYYGIQTERARRHFAVSGETLDDHPTFIRAIAAVKKAAALANRDLGALDADVSQAIVQAAEEIMAGAMASQFPVDVLQGGGYTSANMNVNEVIANRANEILTGRKGYDRVHPNTHVNMCQSTNDVVPSAVRMTSHLYLQELGRSLAGLEAALHAKAEEFSDVVKVSRTCLQDAVPITLGQEFGAYEAFVRRQARQLEGAARACLVIPLGATAVGTGIGALPGYAERVYGHLRQVTDLPVEPDPNLFDALQTADVYVQVSAALKALAVGLSKMARDLRLMSSGPRAGLGEIELPALQPGSSIMPGKVNPVIPELITQVCYQVCGNDFAVTMAAEGGELDLNVWEPLVLRCLTDSCRLLTRAVPFLAEACVRGIRANRTACRAQAESSLALSVVVSAMYGYEEASGLAKRALARGETVKQAATAMGLIQGEEADALLDPFMLADPDRSARALAHATRSHPTQGA